MLQAKEQSMEIETSGRSSIERLPDTLREAVDAAIADGATIDEITARIRGEGGACSRSAVGRHAKNVRDLIRQQHEADRATEAWVRALGERAEGRAGPILIETLRTLALATMAHLSQREEPASPEELGRLALALKRIEGTDKLRIERERAAAMAAPGAGQPAGRPAGRKGLSPETVAAMREAILGRPRPPERAVSSAPVDPWSPAESHSSHLIPANPASKSRARVSLRLEGLDYFPRAAGAGFFISLRRRALAPLACLRAYARGAVAPSGPAARCHS